MATPTLGATPSVENTPYGKFWIGKSDDGSTSIKERRLGSLGFMRGPVRTSVRSESFGVGLAAGPGGGKRLQPRRCGIDLADAMVWREIDAEAARVEDLRNDTDVGQR